MSRSKISIFIILIAVALILVGCSADALQNADMGRLQNAGLGKAGNRLVDEATASIDGFVESYESCFGWNEEPFKEEGGKKLAYINIPVATITAEDPLSFDGNERITESVSKVVSAILKALETSASDEDIRYALLQPYEGVLVGGDVYRTMGGVVGGIVGDEVRDTIEMLVTMFNEEAGAGVDRVLSYSIPIPTYSYDFLILLDKALEIVTDNVPLVLKLLNFDPLIAEDTGSKALSASYLQYIPDGIESDVGDRDYQTVGDKIAFAIIYDIFDALYEIFRGFNELFSDDADAFTPGWIVKNTADQFDRLISDFTVLGYIYGVHIEYAGFVGDMID